MDKFYKRILVFLLIFSLLVSFQSFSFSASPRVKYVIVMIADGCGFAHIGLTQYVNKFVLNEKTNLTDELFKRGNLAIVTTYSNDALVPDSASAGTALATGYKTNNGMISTSPDGKILKTVAERAKELGYKIGLVVTSNVTDATPAVWASHVKNRTEQAEIASQYLQKGIDVILGGGRDYWIPKSEKGSLRQDDRNLIEEAKNLGYNIVYNLEQLERTNDGKLLGLFANGNMPFMLDADPTVVPSLSDMTQKAIELLSKNSNGFFLIVEGSRIDHASHNNDAASVTAEVRAFDKALGIVLDFYKAHPRETLLLVTTDHDNGGLSLTEAYDTQGKERYATVDDLNAIFMVPFSFEKARQTVGTSVTKEGVDKLFKDHYVGTLNIPEEWKQKLVDGKIITPSLTNSFYANLGAGFTSVFMVSWSTNGHTGTPVWAVSLGYGSARFKGYIDNTDIAKLLFWALGENSK
ncbi:MAG: alkaline phosphatase [bacterium]